MTCLRSTPARTCTFCWHCPWCPTWPWDLPQSVSACASFTQVPLTVAWGVLPFRVQLITTRYHGVLSPPFSWVSSRVPIGFVCKDSAPSPFLLFPWGIYFFTLKSCLSSCIFLPSPSRTSSWWFIGHSLISTRTTPHPTTLWSAHAQLQAILRLSMPPAISTSLSTPGIVWVMRPSDPHWS